MRGRTLHRPSLGDLLVFLRVNCPYNLYRVSVLRDRFNAIFSLICMFATYMWLITGFWLRLSTAVNVFGVSSSQPLSLKKIVACTKSHLFEIPVMVKPHFSDERYCNCPRCFNAQFSSSTAWLAVQIGVKSELAAVQLSKIETLMTI